MAESFPIDDEEIDVEDIEIVFTAVDLLVPAIFQMYGYDFRSYSKASIRRRIMHRMGMSNFSSIMEMTDKVLRDRRFFVTLLNDLTVNDRDVPGSRVLSGVPR